MALVTKGGVTMHKGYKIDLYLTPFSERAKFRIRNRAEWRAC